MLVICSYSPCFVKTVKIDNIIFLKHLSFHVLRHFSNNGLIMSIMVFRWSVSLTLGALDRRSELNIFHSLIKKRYYLRLRELKFMFYHFTLSFISLKRNTTCHRISFCTLCISYKNKLL